MKYPTLVILGLILALVLTGEAKSKSKKQKNKLKEQFQKEAILPLAEPCKPANCKDSQTPLGSPPHFNRFSSILY